MMSKIIPGYFRLERAAPFTRQLEKDHEYLKARNILVNKTVATMTSADWGNILTYCGWNSGG
jgi:hypothetical protein